MTALLARVRPALLGLRAPVLALLAGGLLPLALAPFDVWPLLAISAGGLFLLLRRATGSGAVLLLGWLYGVGKYAVGGSWIYVSIHVYGAAPPPLAILLVALFVAGMALFPAAMAWVFSLLRRRVDASANPCTDAALFSGLWVLFEWLLTWVLTGFPWLFAGYAMLDTPLVALAPVGGVLLVSLAAVFTSANLAVAVRSRLALVCAALPWLVTAALAGVSWTERGESRTVALVQGNVPQELKWLPESRQMILARYRDLTAQVADRDIVIWPEAAIPVYLHRVGAYLDSVREETRSDLVLGIPVARGSDETATLHNGAVSTGGGTYLKRRLVPFGEYVPLEGLLRGLIGFFDLPMSRSSPGGAEQPLLLAGGVPLATVICYEIAYPDMVRRDAADAAALVTVSNDTWFGGSIGPHQHMQIARMRAVETGRYLLRATNNGITGIVDERGDPVPARALLAGKTTNDVAVLPQFQAGVLDGSFHVVHGQTPFVRFGHAWLLALVAAIALAIVRNRLLEGRHSALRRVSRMPSPPGPIGPPLRASEERHPAFARRLRRRTALAGRWREGVSPSNAPDRARKAGRARPRKAPGGAMEGETPSVRGPGHRQVLRRSLLARAREGRMPSLQRPSSANA